jgi:hypothetical protein
VIRQPPTCFCLWYTTNCANWPLTNWQGRPRDRRYIAHSRAEERDASNKQLDEKNRQLNRTIADLTESNAELETVTRELIVGAWDVKVELDEEKLRERVTKFGMPQDQQDWMIESVQAMSKDATTVMEFNANGTARQTTTAPSIPDIPIPFLLTNGVQDTKWTLVEQDGRRTTLRLTRKGLAGIKDTTEFTITRVDKDTFTLMPEDSSLKSFPLKPIVYTRRK